MIASLLFLACTGDKTPTESPPPDSSTDDSAVDSTDSPVDPGPFRLTVPALTSSEGDPLAAECPFVLPVAYECANPNPQILWENVPEGTVALALVFDDPDARGYDHWAVVNLPPEAGGIDEGVSGQTAPGTLPGEAYELENGFGWVGYLGSCPPSPHVYRWRLWALSAPLPTDLTRFGEVENQAEALSLGVAETCHIYGPATN